jgi:hypothetical protein
MEGSESGGCGGPAPGGDDGQVTAQPSDHPGDDDPVEILRVLPARYHGQFLADYDAVVAGARRPEQYGRLRYVLRLWRLRAVAYSDPGFEARLEAARTRSGGSTPIEDLVPDWADRVAAARRRRAEG